MAKKKTEKNVVVNDYDPETYVEKYWRQRREAEAAEKEIHKVESVEETGNEE